MAKKLVAYFSASGVTKKTAKIIADNVGADLFEIVPEEIYTRADLNWMDKKSRSTIEMADRNCRPAVASKLENMADYDVVFLGFPIWWGREPSVVDTFLEQYDFSGKTIIPFATSGGSGLGKTESEIRSVVKGATVTSSKLIRRDSEIPAWISSLKI